MMKKKIILTLLILSLSIMVSDITFNNNAIAESDDIVVIINKNRSSLTNSQVAKIFTAKMDRWPNGDRIKVLINKDQSIYESFCNKYLSGKSTKSIDSLWVKRQVRSGKAVPRKVTSTIIKMMISNSNLFIGFIKRSEGSDKFKVIE